jgi:hypothetical protein
LDFLFEIHSESDEASMKKVVPPLKYFPSIFYFKFLEYGKPYLDWIKFCAHLNQIWIILNPFEPDTVPPRPACQPAQPPGIVAMAR